VKVTRSPIREGGKEEEKDQGTEEWREMVYIVHPVQESLSAMEFIPQESRDPTVIHTGKRSAKIYKWCCLRGAGYSLTWCSWGDG